MSQSLQEVVLSASPALTAVHDLKTGALLTAFKAASGSSSGGDQISRDSSNAGADSSSSSTYRKTVDVVQSCDGQGGLIVAAVPGKAAITIWSFQRVSPIGRSPDNSPTVTDTTTARRNLRCSV